METSNSNRETILRSIRANLPKIVEHPGVGTFAPPPRDLREMFVRRLRAAGATAHNVANVAELESKMRLLHPDAKVICSAVQEIAGTRRVEKVSDPHELADVDGGVIRAQFGVAETGALWITHEDLVVDALGFLSQRLIVLLDPGQIVLHMHEAYRRVRLNETAFGCFMMGSSAIADVEATLVHGAQGARSLNLFFV